MEKCYFYLYIYLFIYLFYLFVYLFIYLFIYEISVQDGRFSIYIFTKYVKTTVFQTSPAEKERNKRLKFQISSFKQQILGKNCCKFQAETRIKY